MTVAELIEALKIVPCDLEVVHPEEAWYIGIQPPKVIWVSGDGKLVADGGGYRVVSL